MNALTTITLTRPDDWHLHLRDGAAMADVLPYTARQFARAIVMPNLRPPVTTTAQAVEYRARILAALPPGMYFEPLMTLYLTDNTSAEEIRAARASGIVHGVKLYPAGATTNSDSGVTDIRKCRVALEMMQREVLPLLIHGEVTDPQVDVFDRESRFIDEVLLPLRRSFPGLRVVLEHITTRAAAQYVAEAEGRIAATITAHHLLHNRNALFSGRLRPHYFCLPVLKREAHREALGKAAVSGNPKFDLSGKVSWMGHYQILYGYDDAKSQFQVKDTFEPNGANFSMSYADLERTWRSFNDAFIVLYPPDREAE